MNIQDMQTLYEYNYWANDRILRASALVSPQELSARAAHGYGSLRATLVHTLDTEYGWRMLCQHATVTPDMAEAEFPTVASIAQRWREEEATMRAYLASLTDGDLAGYVRYTTSSGQPRERVLWHCLLHIVNHGTQHRSEAADLLTEYGSSPGDLDFTVFLNEQR